MAQSISLTSEKVERIAILTNTHQHQCPLPSYHGFILFSGNLIGEKINILRLRGNRCNTGVTLVASILICGPQQMLKIVLLQRDFWWGALASSNAIQHQVERKQPQIRRQSGRLPTILQVNLNPHILIRKIGVFWNDKFSNSTVFPSEAHEWPLSSLERFPIIAKGLVSQYQASYTKSAQKYCAKRDNLIGISISPPAAAAQIAVELDARRNANTNNICAAFHCCRGAYHVSRIADLVQ